MSDAEAIKWLDENIPTTTSQHGANVNEEAKADLQAKDDQAELPSASPIVKQNVMRPENVSAVLDLLRDCDLGKRTVDDCSEIFWNLIAPETTDNAEPWSAHTTV